MVNEDGRSPSGPGCSAEPGPNSVVPAVPVSIPNADWLRINLTRPEASAFLALFAGARSRLKCFVHGETKREDVSFGKAECEWVPFRDTWQHKFPALGLTTFDESEPRPALGMVSGSTWTEITIGVTDFGRAVRDAFWQGANAASVDRSPEGEKPQAFECEARERGRCKRDAQP